jgi:hypothetical protein
MGKAFEAGFSDSERRCNNLSWACAPTTSAAVAAMNRDLSCLDAIRSAICMAVAGLCTSFYTPRLDTEGILRYRACLFMRCFVGIALDWDARPKHSAAAAALYLKCAAQTLCYTNSRTCPAGPIDGRAAEI